MAFNNQEFQTRPPAPRLNLAIGPSCPVRCEGCYNNFGESFFQNTLVSADEIVDFSEQAWEKNIDGVTLSGGDPLTHPEIEDIIQRLSGVGFGVKLDTVGTALLEDSTIVYKGRGTRAQVDIGNIKDSLQSVTLPLDGVTQATIENFRKGRRNLLDETKAVAHLLRDAGVVLEFNTVVNASNVDSLGEIGQLARSLGAGAWHVFEYDTSGPNPSRHKVDLAVTPELFDGALEDLRDLEWGDMRLDLRTRSSRVGEGAYFFVNDSGNAWAPTDSGIPLRYGHITRDRDAVIGAYDKYLEKFWEKFTKKAE